MGGMILIRKNRNTWWKPCHHIIYSIQAVCLFITCYKLIQNSRNNFSTTENFT